MDENRLVGERIIPIKKMDFGKGVLNPSYTMRPVGKVFMAEYAKFIADKNVKLGSNGQLEEVRKLIGK